MSRRNLSAWKTAVFDTETDPFKDGRIPTVFTAGFMAEDGTYLAEWGPGCIARIMKRIQELEESYLVYVHNGGRFDFHVGDDQTWIFEFIDDPVFIINGRIIEFCMGKRGRVPHHIWRDSLAIIPVPLSDYQKTKIDYSLFEPERRDIARNRLKIEAYLKDDCRDLLDLVCKFRSRFTRDDGKTPITVGQTALREFKDFHKFSKATERSDKIMRPFYFGGRTQCFDAGILKGPWVYYDINSSYPSSMRNFTHPITDDWQWEEINEPPDDCPVYFADIIATNRQALPVRLDNKTEFSVSHGRFLVCSHELELAKLMGLVDVHEYKRIYVPRETGNFAAFVDFWGDERTAYKKKGDKANSMFCKFVMNSCYGKLGTDPTKFEDWRIERKPFGSVEAIVGGFLPARTVMTKPFIELWKRPSQASARGYHNVGIAASITSASRAIMLQGLCDAVDPVYCDTDSVVCRSFEGDIDPYRLGAWKHETWTPPGETKEIPVVADYVAIAGRKSYCLFNMEGRKVIPIKWASKGADLKPSQIIGMARGKEFDFVSDRPTFSIKQKTFFSHRKMRATVDNTVKPFSDANRDE